MHDRDVTGEQVGELRQKQGRPQVAHQAFVEETVMFAGHGAGLGEAGQNRAVDRNVALAPAGRYDHIHAAEDVGITLDAGAVEGKPGSIDADALPRLHLALIALLGDLGIEAHGRERMHDVGRVAGRVEIDSAVGERLPMGLGPLAKTRQDADAGDPGFPVHCS